MRLARVAAGFVAALLLLATDTAVAATERSSTAPVLAPTVPPATVAGRLVPRNDTEEFQPVDGLIDPVSKVLDETIRSRSGISWRVQRRSDVTVVRRDSSSPVPIAGGWALGVVTARGHRSGVSADGSTLVLADVASRNRFALIRSAKVRVLQFSGSFAIDAVSNDGRTLYLTESVEESTATSAVRKADLVTGSLPPIRSRTWT